MSTAQNKGFLSRLFTSDFHYDFVGKRKFWFIFSTVLLLICIGSLAFRGLNLGIDFQGGSVFKAKVEVSQTTVQDFQDAVNNTGLPDLQAQVNTLSDSDVRVQTRSLETEEIPIVREAIANQANIGADDVTYSLIGPSWGQQITNQALLALGIFCVLVFGLIWIYFRDWKSSVAAIISLIHDTIITIGVFSIIGFTVTPSTFIGVLTILGYSLYDTVVVFDMVRENTHQITKRKDATFASQVNLAVNQVLVRSINTTIIVLLPIIALLIAGVFVLNGEGPLAELGLSLLIGIISGAYSSLFIAAPLYSLMRERETEIASHTKRVESIAPKKASDENVQSDDSNESDEKVAVEQDLEPVTIKSSAGDSEFLIDEQQANKILAQERRQPKHQSRSSRIKK